MATKTWAIALMVLCTAFTSFAQILYKLGSAKLDLTIAGTILNLPLISGMVLYGLGAIIMIIAFSGGDVSALYPVVATSYVWVALLSVYFFHESLSVLKLSGIAIVIAGIIFISIGSKAPEAA